MADAAYITSGRLPREVVPGLYWLGGCSNSGAWPGRDPDNGVHEPCSAWLVVGSEKSILVDTGHVAHWYAVEPQLEQALAGRDLDYVFPTHQELPHAGNLQRLFDKYPAAVAVGDVRDYHLFFPDIDRARLVDRAPGDELDLGDTRFVFLEAIWRDLSGSMWGYDTARRALFPSDGLGHLHLHSSAVCGLLGDELPEEFTPVEARWFANGGAFHWMRWKDPTPTVAQYRALIERYPVEVVCSAHSAPLQRDVPAFTEAMLAAIVGGGGRSLVGHGPR